MQVPNSHSMSFSLASLVKRTEHPLILCQGEQELLCTMSVGAALGCIPVCLPCLPESVLLLANLATAKGPRKMASGTQKRAQVSQNLVKITSDTVHSVLLHQ